jgi:hypothetical protein
MDEWRNGFQVSEAPALLDVDAIHGLLQGSYWATGIPRAVVEKSLRGSLCFGIYSGRTQVGFAHPERYMEKVDPDVYIRPPG